MHTFILIVKYCLAIVEVMFNQSTYVINEETQLLMVAIKISRASQVPVGISINVTNTTTTGMYVCT